jgi:DNA-binding FadR family transcriptional regulator
VPESAENCDDLQLWRATLSDGRHHTIDVRDLANGAVLGSSSAKPTESRLHVPPGCTRTQAILENLGRSIVSGRYPVVGAIVTEAGLCRHFGVARGSLREAVRGLRAKGLIDMSPRRGVWVREESRWNLLDPDILRWLLDRQPSYAIITELFQARLAIQPRAAALAADAVRDGSVPGVVNAVNRAMTIAREICGMSGIVDFHTTVLRASGNRFFEQMAGLVQVSIQLADSYSSGALYSDPANGQLIELVGTRILEGDADGAEQASINLVKNERVLLNSNVCMDRSNNHLSARAD